jgi:hypothetical protein
MRRLIEGKLGVEAAFALDDIHHQGAAISIVEDREIGISQGIARRPLRGDVTDEFPRTAVGPLRFTLQGQRDVAPTQRRDGSLGGFDVQHGLAIRAK